MDILVVDDESLVRCGVAALVVDLADDVRCTGCSNGTEALALIRAGATFELVILEPNRSRPDAKAAIAQLRAVIPDTPIVVLSSVQDPRRIRQAIAAGARGYVPKSASPAIILGALKLVLDGDTYLPPGLIPAPPPSGSRPGRGARHHLTPRQRDVLRLLVRGRSNKQIAYRLGMAENTVRVHVTAILRSLGVTNRTEAGYVATRRGLLGE